MKDSLVDFIGLSMAREGKLFSDASIQGYRRYDHPSTTDWTCEVTSKKKKADGLR
jgi:hypothetical protein